MVEWNTIKEQRKETKQCDPNAIVDVDTIEIENILDAESKNILKEQDRLKARQQEKEIEQKLEKEKETQ